MNRKNYRPEIDGLRAVSILLVVIYHAFPGIISGGFIGVDVFFVISGYLIGRNIITDIDCNKFTLRSFYEKRARRLTGPLIITYFITYIACYYILLPADFASFCESLFSSVTFVSNIYFNNTDNYFAVESHFKPLLHTWSLSVEEQYYLLIPLILIISTKFRKRSLSITFLTMISFISCLLVNSHNNTAAFYLLPYRAWELLIGLLTWLLVSHIKTSPTFFRETLSFTGISIIILPSLLYDNHTLFPGLSAALPCLGAAFIIYSCYYDITVIGKLLSLKPVVYVGKVSYSWYLWHWPSLALTHYYFDRPLSILESILTLFLSFIASCATVKFIEKPIRFTLPPKFKVLYLYATFAFISITFSVAGIQSNGFDFRLSPQVKRFMDARNDWTKSQFKCVDKTPSEIINNQLCSFGENNKYLFHILLWGDSHSTAILPPLIYATEKLHGKLTFIGTNGCPPILGISTDKQLCLRTNNAIMRNIRQNNYNVVILAGRWNSYGYTNPAYLNNNPISIDSHALRDQFDITVKQITNYCPNLILFGQVPSYSIDIPNYLVRVSFHKYLDSFFNYKRPLPKSLLEPDYFNKVASKYSGNNIKVITPSQFMTGTDGFLVQRNGASLYKDSSHLSHTGSMMFSDLFCDTLSKLNLSK